MINEELYEEGWYCSAAGPHWTAFEDKHAGLHYQLSGDQWIKVDKFLMNDILRKTYDRGRTDALNELVKSKVEDIEGKAE